MIDNEPGELKLWLFIIVFLFQFTRTYDLIETEFHFKAATQRTFKQGLW